MNLQTDHLAPVNPTSVSAARHARDLARQIKAGGMFRCPKTRKETTMERCLEKRRFDALERAARQGSYYPCLECALVTPEALMPPENPKREPAPKPPGMVKAKKAKPKPAKKDPPKAVQPNIQEARARSEAKPKPKERSMTSNAGKPEQKYNWKKCPLMAGNPNHEPPFMTITNSLHIGISAQAVRDFGLQEIRGIVFYFSDSPRAIGMELHKEPTPESHSLKIKKHAGRLSCKRYIRTNGLQDLQGKRFTLRQERPGFLVADLEA